MGSRWTEREIEILTKNYGKIPATEIYLLLDGRSIDTIWRKANYLGLQGMNLWTEKENNLLREHYTTLTMPRLKSLLSGRTKSAILIQAVKLGLAGDKTHRHYYLNDNYFKKLTSENCFYAGFFAGDASINLKKNLITIGLKGSDGGFLESLSKKVGFDGKVSYNNKKSGPYVGYQVASIRFVSETWVHDLEYHFNIIPNKSLVLKAPNLNDPILIMAYIIGCLDADGYVCFSNRTDRPKGGYAVVGFTGSQDLLSFIKQFFDQFYPDKLQANLCPMGKIFRYAIVGKRAERILSDMLKVDLPRLERKKNMTLEVISR